jgi:hypothetical protein
VTAEQANWLYLAVKKKKTLSFGILHLMMVTYKLIGLLLLMDDIQDP